MAENMQVENTGSGSARIWLAEIEKAERRDEKSFVKRGKKIVQRYRDSRENTDTGMRGSRRKFNILWSNVQTLKPALFGRMPEPICERRFLDHDPIGRIASTILERTLRYDIEDNGFHQSLDCAVLDLLLPGRGTVWLRYEPKFGEEISPKQEGGSPHDQTSIGSGNPAAGDNADPSPSVNGPSTEQAPSDGEYGAGNAPEIIDECVYPDYVFWQDFLTSEARVWSEVTWVGRRLYMGKPELRQRAKDTGNKAWLSVPIERPRDATGRFMRQADGDTIQKGEVYEIWDKDTRTVKFIAKGVPDIIEERDDPLGLENFWPTPRPMYATQTTDTLEPVADYFEYQDQAEELDSLTNRIAALTRSLKVAGVYAAASHEIQRLMDEGVENKLIPVNDWASFAEAGGIDGVISWMPLKEIAATLLQLFDARERVKQDLYEITGIADIIRGQSDPNETATAQQIKGSFATQRLQARQQEVARYCRDVLAIHAEIAAEHYAPETLILKSSIMFNDGLEEDEATELDNPGMGHNGGPPMDEAQMNPTQVQTQEAQEVNTRQQQVMQAIELLKNEKLRGFRIDIETDSTIAVDKQQDKEQAVEFVTAMSGYLEKMTQAALTPAGPIIVPFASKMLGWAVRRFGTGRDLESALDQFIETANAAMKAQAQQGPEEDPAVQAEAMRAQAEQQKTQADLQITQLKAALDAQQAQTEAQIAQMKAEMDMQLEQMKIALKERQMAAEMRRDEHADELADREHARAMAQSLRQESMDEQKAAMQEQQMRQRANGSAA